MGALPRAVRALNSKPHPHVFDAAPEDMQPETVQENKELVRHVDVQAGVSILAKRQAITAGSRQAQGRRSIQGAAAQARMAKR